MISKTNRSFKLIPKAREDSNPSYSRSETRVNFHRSTNRYDQNSNRNFDDAFHVRRGRFGWLSGGVGGLWVRDRFN